MIKRPYSDPSFVLKSDPETMIEHKGDGVISFRQHNGSQNSYSLLNLEVLEEMTKQARVWQAEVDADYAAKEAMPA